MLCLARFCLSGYLSLLPYGRGPLSTLRPAEEGRQQATRHCEELNVQHWWCDRSEESRVLLGLDWAALFNCEIAPPICHSSVDGENFFVPSLSTIASDCELYKDFEFIRTPVKIRNI